MVEKENTKKTENKIDLVVANIFLFVFATSIIVWFATLTVCLFLPSITAKTIATICILLQAFFHLIFFSAQLAFPLFSDDWEYKNKKVDYISVLALLLYHGACLFFIWH